MQTIKLKLRQTSQKGFLVSLTCSEQQVEIEGFLPLFPKVLQAAFRQWQAAYRQLEEVRLSLSPQPGFRLTPKAVTVASNTEYANAVTTRLNQWLNSAHREWQPIREGLISLANQLESGEIQFIVDTKEIHLRRLPWQEWDLLEKYYPSAEVALSTPKDRDSTITQNLPFPNGSKPRILLVVGRSNGINTQSDLEVIQQLEERGAEVICLMQPSLKDLCETLWDEQGYHIFVFTGHSGSGEDGEIGWLEINNRESLSIEEFRNALKEAINRGLQLAIFNSCDGLGLANQLAQLNLPQSIVMREPIPDEVAVDFLQYFFNEFLRNQSLFTCVQKARKRLEHFHSRYPGSVWLPTLCLQPSVQPLTWQSFGGNFAKLKIIKSTRSKIQKNSNISQTIGTILIASFVSFALGFTAHFALPAAAPASPYAAKISAVEARPRGTWQYGGSTTWGPIRAIADREIKRKHPDFKLIYTPHPTLPAGSGTGIAMLLEGELSFSQSSRPVRDSEYEKAARRGVMLKQVPVALDGIAVAVRSDLKIKGLTIQQLKNIYTNRVKNWQQLGGEDLEIVPYSRSLQSGTTGFFQENVLGRKSFGENVVFVDDTAAALDKVKSPDMPGGIYFASATEIVGKCGIKPLAISYRFGSAFVAPYTGELVSPENCTWQQNVLNFEALQNGEYPLTRRLFVIIDQNRQADEKAGETYKNFLLTDEGQKLIKKAEFIPIRSF